MRLVTLLGPLCAATMGCTGAITGDPGAGPAGTAGAGPSSAGGPAAPKGPPSGDTTGVAPAGDPPAEATCGGAVPGAGPAPVRRLTKAEYNNTVRDLLGDTSNPASDFSDDGHMGAFDSNLDVPANPMAANQYLDAAEALATRAISRLDTLVPCKPAGLSRDNQDACARAFVLGFGKRAFRRPLTAAEIDRYTGLYADTRAARGRDFTDGVWLIVAAMLQSPHFLNHIERGVPAGKPGLFALTPYELASRLSYTLWQSPPDDALTAAADAGTLATPADLERETRRMMGDARARVGLWAFYDQLMSLAKLETVVKDKAYPFFTPALAASMRKETQAMVGSVLWDGDGTLSTLLTAPQTFVNAALATNIYGLKTVTGDALTRIDGAPTRRSGILTQPSFLTIQAHADETDPIHRGKFVRERLFCQHMPPPPPDVNTTPPIPDPKQTTRQRYSSMLNITLCAGCHRLMNLIGLGFENYDTVGRFRTMENGLPIDASGEIIGTAHTNGLFDGAHDLGTRLAASPDVQLCMADTWFSYAMGRPTLPGDQCVLDQLHTAFDVSGGNLHDIVLALVKTDAFRYRAADAAEVCQ